MGTSCLSVPNILLVVLLTVGVAPAQTFTNGSFETGDFTGWQVAPGSTPAVIGGPGVVSGGAPTPPNGQYQALLNSTGAVGSGAPDIYANGNSVSAAVLNSFLNTVLPANGNGAAQDGEAIQQTFTTTNGATITFSYAFESRELAGNGYDETGYVLNGVFHILADTNTPNQSSANHTEFLLGGVPYQTIALTVGPGTTTLGFVAYNTFNTSAPSGLFVDNVVVTPLPTVNFATIDPPLSFTPTPATLTGTQLKGVSGNNVVGIYQGSDTVNHSFFYNSGAFTLINFPGSTETQVVGVSGQNVAGVYTDSSGQHGFFYDGTTTYTELNPGSSFSTVNAVSGNDVVGSYVDAQGQHGFFYDGNVYTPLDPPDSSPANDTTTASGVSGNLVVGYYKSVTDGNTHGFLYNVSSASFSIVDPAGSTGTQATAVSGSNVVGSYVDSHGQHGFIYNSSTSAFTAPIDPPGSVTNQDLTTITGVSGNNVVGYYYDGTTEHGFYFDGTTYTAVDPSLSGGTEVAGISGHNVVGSYLDSSMEEHGFLSGVNKTTAIVSIDHLFTVWSGSSQSVVVTTNSANINTVITYTGTGYPTSTTPPTNVGTYTVAAAIVDPNYQGSATGTFVIGKAAPQAIDLGNLSPTYDGTPKAVSVSTNPANLNIIVTYSSSSYPSSTTPPTAVGSYSVVATVDPNDPHFQGTSGATLVISPATLTVTLNSGSLAATFDGTPKAVTATTGPTANVSLAFTYTGSSYPTSSTPPSAIGTYTVVATVSNPNYLGSAMGSLVISGNSSSVNFSDWESSFMFSGAAAVASQNDGVPNLLKYFYDIDPTRPMTMADRAALPELGTTTINGLEFVTLTFREYGLQIGVNFFVEVSSDLQNWSSLPTSSNPTDRNTALLIILDTDPNSGDLTVEAGVPVSTGNKTFIRLNFQGP